MPDLPTIALFVTASTLLLIVPGPTITLVLARSLSQGRRVALPLVLGVGLGDLVAGGLSLAGAGALLAASATAFTIVKWLGAAYLIWLGVRLFRSEPVPPAIDTAHTTSSDDGTSSDTSRGVRHGGAGDAFRDGFLVTVFNPKGILFFVAFVPPFIDAGSAYAPQAAFFVATFAALGAANCLVYTLAADLLRRRVTRSPGVLRVLNRVGGTAIAASGVAALFARRPAGEVATPIAVP